MTNPISPPKTLLIIARLEKKTCNKIRSNFAVRINIPKIITKLTMALKLGLPTRFKIKDCKFRFAFAKIAYSKINLLSPVSQENL